MAALASLHALYLSYHKQILRNRIKTPTGWRKPVGSLQALQRILTWDHQETNPVRSQSST